MPRPLTLREIHDTLDGLDTAYDALLDVPYDARDHIKLTDLYDAVEAATERMTDLLRTAELASSGKQQERSV